MAVLRYQSPLPESNQRPTDYKSVFTFISVCHSLSFLCNYLNIKLFFNFSLLLISSASTLVL
jgi:hypothetical protein